jgi:diaminohydroxyphosphoribosylaminopyrimidine deaminase/5-amino-6-(5-phosphoribosylamino)uracil reductase
METRELNLGFFSRMLRQRPWVRLKLAASLDGKTALPNGDSQWITAQAARADGHAWRQRAGTVLTGVGTVLHDNPRLDARLAPEGPAPDLAVIDSRLRTPPQAQLFEPQRRVLVYCAEPDPGRQDTLQRRGATVVCLPAPADTGAPPQVDLAAVLRDLAQREVNELHVEAGHTLNGALLRQSLADELLVYLAPLLLGVGLDMAGLGPFSALSQGARLDFQSVQALGPDIRLLARQTGWQDWLA